MKVIISGIGGFIGSQAAVRLVREGHDVVGFDNLSRRGAQANIAWLQRETGGGEVVKADVRSMDDVCEVFSGHTKIDLVLHQAAQVAVSVSVANPREDFEVNALGTLNLLEATRRYAPGATFFYASTNKVYGSLKHIEVTERNERYEYTNHPEGIAETEPIDFHSPYGCSKGAADQYVRDYSRIYGMRTVVFRQSCIYGPRQFGIEDQGWVAWFAIAAVLGKPVTIYGDGKQVRDILWVDDLIDLYLRAWDRIDLAAGQIYNVGGGPKNCVSLLEVLGLLSAACGHRIEHQFTGWRPGDQRVFVANCSKARRELEWWPRVTPGDGIRRLVSWVQQSQDVLRDVVT